MPRNYTVDAKGTKRVTMRNTDYEKQHVTVMLCITADGHKLPPHIFLNRRITPRMIRSLKMLCARTKIGG
jgi:hypothetical protein